MVNHVTYMVHEILDQVSKAKSRTDKIKILQQNQNNWAMKDILRGTFDDLVQWNLPKGKVPYEPADERSSPSNLSQHNKKFEYFLPNTVGAKMAAVKREKILGIPSYSDVGRAINEGSIYHTIFYGKNSMGSYAGQLNEEERWLVTHYVLKLKSDLEN